MDNKLFLIIKTNSYTGNFDRELMAYVFGFDKDGLTDEIEIFENEMGEENKYLFYDYLNTFAFGEHDGEYSCYKNDAHPTSKENSFDSFYICLQKKLPKDLSNIMLQRLSSFCEYYNKKYSQNLEILNVNYYENRFTKIEEEIF